MFSMISLVAIIIGIFVFGVSWSIYKIVSGLPDEDRSFLDRPPSGFRMVWPLVNVIAHYFGGFLTQSYLMKTVLRLRRAGVEFSVGPEQFFAGKLISATFFSLAAVLLQSMLEKEGYLFFFLGFLLGFMYPEIWLKETMDKRNKEIFKELPFFLDVITLAVESGTNLTNGIHQAVQKAPDGPLRNELSRVLRDMRAGKRRSDALRDLADRVSTEGLSQVVSSMIQAEKTGASLGAVLRAQSDQLRTSRFMKAEKMAMEAPVKLLGPLISCIFPTTFIVIGFVILSKAISEGIITFEPLLWAYTNP